MTTLVTFMLSFASTPEGVALLGAAWVATMSAASGLCQRLGYVRASKITAGLAGLDVGGVMRWAGRVRAARTKILP